MTWARPTVAPSIWRSPASRAGGRHLPDVGVPVAAIGWPFDSRPPDTLTGVEPSRQVARTGKVDGTALGTQAEVVVVHELSGGEAVVQLDEIEILGADAGELTRPERRRCGSGC